MREGRWRQEKNRTGVRREVGEGREVRLRSGG